jgi:hypothetical protein
MTAAAATPTTDQLTATGRCPASGCGRSSRSSAKLGDTQVKDSSLLALVAREPHVDS